MANMSRILFLAQFAPENDVMLTPPINSEELFYAETYHLKIIESLNRLGYNFFPTSNTNHLVEKYYDYDLVWSLYNRLGFRNSEIFVQSLCEYYSLKYIGAAPNIRALIEDKSMSKQLAQHLGIRTAKWCVASKQYPLSELSQFPGPYFVKPRFGSASLGIDESCVCDTWKEAIAKSEEYYTNCTEILVEEFIEGVYFGVPIVNTIDNKPIVAIPHYQRSSKDGGVITYSQKRFVEAGMTRHICCDEYLNKVLTYTANQYFVQIQPCDYARIDFLVDNKSGIPYFLEVNALMNLGVRSGFVESFLHEHFETYDDLIRHIVELGIAKLN